MRNMESTPSGMSDAEKMSEEAKLEMKTAFAKAQIKANNKAAEAKYAPGNAEPSMMVDKSLGAETVKGDFEFGSDKDSAKSLLRELPNPLYTGEENKAGTRLAAEDETTESAMADIHKEIKVMPKAKQSTERTVLNSEAVKQVDAARAAVDATPDLATEQGKATLAVLDAYKDKIKEKFGVEMGAVLGFWAQKKLEARKILNKELRDAMNEYVRLEEELTHATEEASLDAQPRSYFNKKLNRQVTKGLPGSNG